MLLWLALDGTLPVLEVGLGKGVPEDLLAAGTAARYFSIQPT